MKLSQVSTAHRSSQCLTLVVPDPLWSCLRWWPGAHRASHQSGFGDRRGRDGSGSQGVEWARNGRFERQHVDSICKKRVLQQTPHAQILEFHNTCVIIEITCLRSSHPLDSSNYSSAVLLSTVNFLFQFSSGLLFGPHLARHVS